MIKISDQGLVTCCFASLYSNPYW